MDIRNGDASSLGHTHPEYSNSGIVSIIAEAYAGADKQRGLTQEDLQTRKSLSLCPRWKKVLSIRHQHRVFSLTGCSNADPSYLSAAVLYENLIVAQESKRTERGIFTNPGGCNLS